MGAISLGRSFPALYVRPLTSLSDERLASLVHGGNDEAFEVLFQRYRVALSRYCRSIVRDPEDARDAHQSTMLAALRALRDRRLSGRVRPWLYRIAHNESISVLRRRRGHEQLDEQTPSPRGEFQQLEQWEILISDLRSLPERQRGALLMRELGGLEYQEIGVALGMSAIRARKAVFEARSALSDNAAGRDADCAEVRLKLSDCDGRMLRGRRVRGHLEACAPCAAFALSLSERRRALATIPAGPGLPLGGAFGGGFGLAAGGVGGVGGGGIAAGGVALGTGSAGLAAKGIASAVCALCAIAGAGAVLDTGQHKQSSGHAAVRIARAHGQPLAARNDRTASSAAPAGGRPSARRARVHVIAMRATAARSGRMPSAAAVRVVARQQPVGRAPRTRIAPATPSAPPVSSAPTTSGTPAATTPTATPISSAAPSTNFQQVLAQLFQSAVAASAGMTPSQQSALSSLEQQWQATDSGAITSSTYASFQDLVSKVMSGTGWSPAASWPATGSGTSSQSTSGTSTAPTGSTQTGSTQTGSTQTGWTQTGSTSAGGGWTAPDQSGWR